MLKNIALITLVSVFFLAGCASDDTTVTPLNSDLTINIKSFYGPNVLVLGNTYNYLDYEVQFDKFKFILSNLELISDNDEVVSLSDVTLIDFKDAVNETEAAKGVNFDFTAIPTGNYKTLRFTIGLDSSYLGLTPADFSSDDILAQSELYWASWGNYIIAKLEARFDENEDGNFLDETFQYHLGGDEAYRNVEKSIDLSLVVDGSSNLELDLDIKDILTLEGSLVDPAEWSATHSTSSVGFIADLLDNFVDAFENN